jgi:hypothetical protein
LWQEYHFTLGHQPQRVNQAIKDQLDKYSHVMVYGEYSQSPAVEYCKLMALIARTIKKTYLVNSGTEAEGALKLARRNRSQPINFLPQRLPWKHYIDEVLWALKSASKFWPLIRMSILSPSITKLI